MISNSKVYLLFAGLKPKVPRPSMYAAGTLGVFAGFLLAYQQSTGSPLSLPLPQRFPHPLPGIETEVGLDLSCSGSPPFPGLLPSFFLEVLVPSRHCKILYCGGFPLSGNEIPRWPYVPVEFARTAPWTNCCRALVRLLLLLVGSSVKRGSWWRHVSVC